MKKRTLYRITSGVLFFLLSWSWVGLGWGILSLPLFFVGEYFVLRNISQKGIIGVGK